MRKFINWITFGWLCKPVWISINGVPLREATDNEIKIFKNINTDDLYFQDTQSVMQDWSNEKVDFSCSFTVSLDSNSMKQLHDFIFTNTNEFTDLDTTLNTLNIPLQSDMEGDVE